PRDKLEDAIERYITRIPLNSGDFARYSVTRLEKSREIELFESVTDEARNASKNAGKANKSGDCDVVTEKGPGAAGHERVEGANSHNGVFDGQRRPRGLKLFATPSEVVGG